MRWILVLAAAIWIAPAAMAENGHIGVIKVVSGPVGLGRNEVMRAAEPGEKVYEEDRIRTGPNGVVGVTFNDNSRLSLGPNSEVLLKEYRRGGGLDDFEIELARGSLSAASGEIAKTREDAMRVITPSSILGVRGTEFVVRTP